MTDVVQKLWGFCHTLRHDGIGYTEYVEQLTYLLFVKMADEKGIDLSRIEVEEAAEDGRKRKRKVDCSWPALRDMAGTDVIDRYIDILRALGKQPGTLGSIYAGAQSRFTKPVSLKTLINRIDETEWTALGVDVKADAYEGLLEKAASEGKKGAGQMFTPRKLIQAIVRCVKPDPRGRKDFAICDPACGTGGFLVAAYEWLMKTKGAALDRGEWPRIRSNTYFGQDIDATPRRLALMNLYLHLLEPQIKLGDTIYDPPERSGWVDVVLTNPPFGTRGANQAPEREVFTIATSNKQLNFVQHVLTILKPGGRAAVVLPDNCLFADQAGEVFKILTEDCDLHTVLRLPRGTFTPYSQGVKANVVFFTKGYPTETTWIYDARTNVPGITKKDRPLTPEHFAEFETCYGSDPNGRARREETDSPAGKGYLGGDRWRRFTIAEVRERHFKLDGFKWLRDEDLENSDDLPEPEELASDAIAELRAAVEDLNAVLVTLENGNGNGKGGQK
jgi:type I restriction enzyme M protein